MAQKAKWLYDDFSTTIAVSGKWYTSNALTGVVSGGVMRIRPTAAYDTVIATATYNLTDSHLGFKLTQNCALGAGTNGITLFASVDSNNSIQLAIDGGRTLANGATVYLRERVGGVDSDTTFTYDPAVHVWFRIREASGTVYWETSTDGTTWTAQRSKTTTLTLTSVEVSFMGGYWGAEAGTTYASIDDFNLWGGVPPADKMDTLTDDFTSLDTNKWTLDTNASVTGGNLAINAGGAGYSGYAGFMSVNTYDLTDSALAYQMVQNLPAGNGSFTHFVAAQIDSSNKVEFGLEGGVDSAANLYFTEKLAGVVSQTSVSYDPLRHKWFRIRSVGTTITWETSRDGTAWTIQRTKTTTLNLTALKVHGEAGYYATEPVPGTLLVDNINLNSGTTIGESGLPAHFFSDDFTTLASWNTGGGWAAVSGTAQCAANNVYNYLTSNATNWDLSNSYYAVQLVQNYTRGASPYDSITMEFRATVVASTDFLSFIVWAGGVMTLREHIGGVNNDIVSSYKFGRDNWLRIRCASGTVYWETSFNGIDWTVRGSKATALTLSSTGLSLIGGCYDAVDVPGMGTAIIDNLNLLPVPTSRGWFIGTIMGGAYDGGGPVVSRDYFQEASWMWDKIPANPVLDADSATISHYLTGADVGDGASGVSWGYYGNAIVHPWQITPSTPRYQVQLLINTLHPDWGFDDTILDPYMVPIPMGTQVPPGSDRHLCIMDPTQGKVFSFWQMNYNSTTDTWAATYGSVADFYGDGRDFVGSSTATNLSRAAGTIRLSELTAGEIPHAIFVASNMCRPGAGWVSPSNPGGPPPFVYPAQKSDGRNLASVPVQYTVVEGTRLQLNPALDLAAIPGITPAELTIGTAWQRYGAYVGDQGGSPSPPTVGAGQVELWQGQDWTPYNEEVNTNPSFYPPIPPPLLAVGIQWDYFDLTNIPWRGNVRVLKKWDGSA